MENKKRLFHIDWILVNEIALGKAPLNEDDLLFLKNQNIKSILNLCNEEEIKIPLGIEKHFKYLRVELPDHKSNRIPTINELNNVLEKLELLVSNGAVYVHCVASMERSPLVCMAWLIKKHKLTFSQSLDYVMQVHKGTSPLSEQLDLLKLII